MATSPRKVRILLVSFSLVAVIMGAGCGGAAKAIGSLSRAGRAASHVHVPTVKPATTFRPVTGSISSVDHSLTSGSRTYGGYSSTTDYSAISRGGYAYTRMQEDERRRKEAERLQQMQRLQDLIRKRNQSK